MVSLMIVQAKEALQFDTIDDVVSDIARGRIVIVTDDADREHEGGGRSCAHGRAATGRSPLRNSARRRNDGALAGADGVPQETPIAHLHDPKLDCASARPRKAGGARASDKIAD